MSRYSRSDPENLDYEPPPSACSNFIHYTWKTITCLLSHITLVSMVVSYCALGAFTFEALEADHEKDVKRNISKIRDNATDHLWKLTNDRLILDELNFTRDAETLLKEFEGALIKAMTKDGWDGYENDTEIQWTTTGSLFYSIIVITTIGYGHISPKTPWGKVVTMFYAILGIPLMLLCLSNIGDIMATSFRFLYWKVCCYVCTKKPKRKTSKFRAVSESRMTRSRNASFRRSVRTSTKSADSGFGLSEIGPFSHSDTELRMNHRDQRGSSLARLRPPPRYGGSLDRKRRNNLSSTAGAAIEMDPLNVARAPVFCNKYVMSGADVLTNNVPPGISARELETAGRQGRAKSEVPKTTGAGNYLEPPQVGNQERGRSRSKSPRPRRKKSPPHHNPSPKMMTPLGYGHKSKYLDDPDSDECEYYDYDDEYYDVVRTRTKPVPIWLCVLLVVSYIIGGAFLFAFWEKWELMDAAYFCFITLTTIGFGDLVPNNNNVRLGAGRDRYNPTISIALCSLYLLFGIALLAMSFNLVQEEVIAKVKNVAKTLGIIKKDEEDDSEEDD